MAALGLTRRAAPRGGLPVAVAVGPVSAHQHESLWNARHGLGSAS